MSLIDFYLYDLKTKFNKINPNDYYLSYSGGRDSHFLLWFIRDFAKIKGIDVIGINTFMEHPQILQRIKDNCDEVLIPKMTPYQIKAKYGSPTFGKWADEMIERYQKGSRSINTLGAITGEGRTVYKISKRAKKMLLNGDLHKVSNKCCKILKKDTAKEYEKRTNKKPILGVRATESNIRKQNYISCFTKNKTFTPIFDLTDALLDGIYEKYNIETPDIYKYISRTGCMGCPYGRYSGNLQKELNILKGNRKKYVVDLFKESYHALEVNDES